MPAVETAQGGVPPIRPPRGDAREHMVHPDGYRFLRSEDHCRNNRWYPIDDKDWLPAWPTMCTHASAQAASRRGFNRRLIRTRRLIPVLSPVVPTLRQRGAHAIIIRHISCSTIEWKAYSAMPCCS